MVTYVSISVNMSIIVNKLICHMRYVNYCQCIFHIQCLRKVFRLLYFFHILLRYCLFLNGWNKTFSSAIYTQHPMMTKQKQVWPFAMRLKIALRCILFLLIIHELVIQLHYSPPVVNSIDWTWFGKACISLSKVPQLTVHFSKNQAMRSKELSVELRDRIVSRHRSGEGYQNISAAFLQHPQEHSGLH